VRTTTGGAATAQDIRRTALELFSSLGYSATTMRQIAAAVGIQAASLYNHFGAKEDILWSLSVEAFAELDGMRERAAAALPPDADAVRRLAAFVGAHTRFHATHQKESALINRQLRGLSADHYETAVARRRAYAGHLQQILTDGVASGAFEVPDVKVAAFALLEMGMGVATWYRSDGPVGVDELTRMHVELAVRMTERRHRGDTAPR
jgi:AcrR family transcriptional regulator